MSCRKYGWAIILLLYSCSGVKFLSENELFYKGATLTIVDRDNSVDHRFMLQDLKKMMEPKANETIFGMRPAVWFYGAMGEPKKKGVRRFIQNTIGSSPVLYDRSIPSRTVRLLENRLFNSGYFDARVGYDIKEKKKDIVVHYQVELGEPFIFNQIHFPADTTILGREIRSTSSSSLLKKGKIYNLQLLKDERERNNQHLKNKGFYYFNPEFIQYDIDSTSGNHMLEVWMRLKDELPISSLKSYLIDSVVVFSNYTVEKDSVIRSTQAVMTDDITYLDPGKKFRHSILAPLIFIHPRQTYALDDHNLTLKRVSELNTFKFINIRFQNSDSSSNRLNSQIYLTPLPTRSLRFEMEAYSKSNNFVGPGISFDFQNRNKWRGAELLSATLSGGFETQITGRNRAVNSYEVGLDLDVTIPRLVPRIPVKTSPVSEIPKTKIQISNRLLRRSGFYRIHKTGVNFGYKWNENKKKFHQLKLVDVNYAFLGSSTDEFDLLLENNPSLQQSFADQLIIGGSYSFTLSTQANKYKNDFLYFNGNLDLAGNTLQLFNGALSSNNESQKEVLGLPYAQYIRGDIDFRYLRNITETNVIASRLIVGLGVPYGNSDQLPFIKQFFIGGSNSIRAFPARGLGPGSFQSIGDTTLFVDQSGDIKLEANLEYRAKIYGVFRGAVFLDAGNVWLVNNDPNRPGGTFKLGNLWSELGIGTGVGLRLDFSYFVFRFDWAFPLKKSYLEKNNGWVIDEIDFLSKKWRQDNLIFNIAIGYPF